MTAFPKKGNLDPRVQKLYHQIKLTQFSQIVITTIHFQMRNGLSLAEVFSDYKFEFKPELLNEIKKILDDPTITGNNIDYLYFMVMHNYIAREILMQTNKTEQPNKELLSVLISLYKKCNVEKENVIREVFSQLFNSFISSDHDDFKIYDLMPYFFEFCHICRNQDLFLDIFKHISKKPADERYTKFLNDFAKYLNSNSTFFSEKSISKIIPLLKSSLGNFNYSAFLFLRSSKNFNSYESCNFSKKCIDKLIPIVIQSIYSKILECPPIQINLSSKVPTHVQYIASMTSQLNFFNTPTLPEGFDPLYSVRFPTILDLSTFFDKETYDILIIISDIFDHCANDFASWYVEFIGKTSDISSAPSSQTLPLPDNIEDLDPELQSDYNNYINSLKSNKSTSHFYNMYLALMVICSQFSCLSLSSEVAAFFFHPNVFNLSDSVFEYNSQDENSDKSDFPVLNTFRSYSLDFILSDSGLAIDRILNDESVISTPLFLAELFNRLINVSALFGAKIETYPKLIKTISNLARNYQHLEIATQNPEKKGEIQKVRVSIFATLAHLFTNVDTLIKFFNDKLFCHSILAFLFEDPVRQFIISNITKYLSKVDLSSDIPFPTIINPILESIKFNLPEHRNVLLLKDLLTAFIEGFSYNQKEKTKFDDYCTSICHSLARLDKDDLSKEVYKLGITFLAIMSSIFNISDLEVNALITGLAAFNDNSFIESLYPKFISLLAGQKVPPSSPNFIIKKPQVLKILLQTYSQPSKCEVIIDYISELCKFSQLNLSECSKSGIDLILLYYLEKAKQNEKLYSRKIVQKILDLYSLITSSYTTVQSVLRYISLMSPLSETTISKFQLQFIDTMANAITLSSDKPASTFLLNGNETDYQDISKEYKDESKNFKLLDMEGKFVLTFWIYIEPDISKNCPKICTIKLSEYFETSIFLSNNELFIELFVYLPPPSNYIEQSSIAIPEHLSLQKWHFISLFFNFNEYRSIIQCSADCGPTKAVLARSIPNDILYQKPQFSIRLGGKYESVNEGVSFEATSQSKMAAIGIFLNPKLEDYIQIYVLGLRNNDKKMLPFDPVYYRNDFNVNDKNKSNIHELGFTDILIEKCGINCILPLFLETDMIMDGKPFTLSLETIITLFVKLLTYSFSAQLSFSQRRGFNIIAELLTERWTKHFTFKNYQQFFQLLVTIQYEQLQQQLFDEVMTNFTFLMMLDSDLHLRIIRHWIQSLFPSFRIIAINFSSFEDLAAILRLFYWYKPIEKMWIKYTDIRPDNLNVGECRKYIMKILFEYAKDYFNSDMFQCIISHCVSCTETKQVIELIQLLISIVTEISNKLKFSVEKDDYLKNFVQYYMKFPNEDIRFLVLELIILLHKSNFITNEFFSQQLNVLIAIISNDAITKQLLDFLIVKMKEDPYLFDLCTFVSTYLDDFTFFSELFIKDNEIFWSKGSDNINEYLSKSNFWEIWFIWIAIYIKPDLTNTLLMLAKDHLLDLLIVYDIFKIKSNEFEDKIMNFILSHHEIIKNFYLICQRLIAFSNESSPLFDNIDCVLFNNKSTKSNQIKEGWDSKKVSPNNFVSTILSEKIEKPGIVFQLKFDNNFNWHHYKLAKLFLSKFEKNIDMNYLQFDLLLCSFLQTTDFDVFDHLCNIYLHDKDVTNFDSILSLLEYHTITNGKRHFLKNIPFSNPFPSQQKFSYFEAQIQPKSYIDALESKYELLKSYLSVTANDAASMKHLDVSSLIEMATQQMQNFIERQEFQNYSNIQSWQKLWSALSIERAPWHIQSQDNKFIRQREITASYGLAPVKMIQNWREIPFWQSTPTNIKIEKRGILESECAILLVDGRYPAMFHLMRNMKKINVHYGKNYEFQLKSIRFIFLRKNFGFQFFTDKGLSIHLEFPEDFFSKLVNELDSSIFKSISSKYNVFMQKTCNSKFFQTLPFQKKWANGDMSNYEYLLMINHCAGRSFLDLQSYPFFPFVLNTTLEEFNYRNFRSDFCDTKPCSRETILSYLCAIEPFKTEYKNLVDVDNFNSFEDILQFAQKNKVEIIPEFYSMPEILEKPAFKLPPRFKCPIEFIYDHRRSLESQYISSSLHIWITQMFGQNSEFKLFEGKHPRKKLDYCKVPLLTENIESRIKPKDDQNVLCALVYDKMSNFTFICLLGNGEVIEVKTVENMNDSSSLFQKMSSLKSVGTPKSTSDETLGSTTSSNNFVQSMIHHSNSNVDDIIKNENSMTKKRRESSIIRKGKEGILSQKGKESILSRKGRESSLIGKVRESSSDPKILSNFYCQNLGKIYLPKNSHVIAKNGKFIVASGSLVIYDSSHKKLTEIESEFSKFTSISADGSCIAAAEGDNAVVSIIRDSKIDQTIQIYKDTLSCISVSSVFNLVAVGTQDGSIVVCSATSGNLICIIPLSEYLNSNANLNNKDAADFQVVVFRHLKPEKVLITPSWGFIVVYSTEIDACDIKHYIFVFTINGSFVRQCEVKGPICYWNSWSSKNGFDFLVYSNEAGRVFITEVFRPETAQEIYVSRSSKVVCAEVSSDQSIISIVSNDGNIALVPICLSENL